MPYATIRPMAAYALTIFTGAFLLFQVQPLIGKYILPWFGGGPGVWTTCMLFFQVLLLGGYAYAHFTSRWLKPRTQAVVHLVLLAAALALLPITPGDSWKPHGGGNPTLQILALLAVSLGLPYFVLSSTGPLIQQWFSRAKPGRVALPALRALERRLAAGAGQLSLLLRDAFHAQDAGRDVGVGTGGLCALLRVLRGETVEVRRPKPRPEGIRNPKSEIRSPNRTRVPKRQRGETRLSHDAAVRPSDFGPRHFLGSRLRLRFHLPPLAAAAGLRVGAAAGDDQQAVPGRGGDSVSSGCCRWRFTC